MSVSDNRSFPEGTLEPLSDKRQPCLRELVISLPFCLPSAQCVDTGFDCEHEGNSLCCLDIPRVPELDISVSDTLPVGAK